MRRKIADIKVFMLLLLLLLLLISSSSYYYYSSRPTGNRSSTLHAAPHTRHSVFVTNKTQKADSKSEIPFK
jgi:uncharacterized protein (UPF0333 family)